MNHQGVLLFDLGGVLVEWSGQAVLRRLRPDIDQGEILARWNTSESVGLFERGSIAPPDFAERFVAEWQLRLEPTEFLESFSSWVRGFYPGAKSLIQRLRTHGLVACLSNTNATHWASLADVQTVFDVCMASHLTGHMKPDRAAFEHAIESLAASPSDVTYFDDSLPNVIAARNVGINAFHVRGLSETESALRSLGLPHGDAQRGS